MFDIFNPRANKYISLKVTYRFFFCFRSFVYLLILISIDCPVFNSTNILLQGEKYDG